MELLYKNLNRYFKNRSKATVELISGSKTTNKDIVEIGLGSIGKIKIMKALAEEARMITVYTLHKKTHLKREDIKRNLDDLRKIGWVNESKLANIMYSINRENEFVNRLTAFFIDVGYIDQQ